MQFSPAGLDGKTGDVLNLKNLLDQEALEKVVLDALNDEREFGSAECTGDAADKGLLDVDSGFLEVPPVHFLPHQHAVQGIFDHLEDVTGGVGVVNGEADFAVAKEVELALERVLVKGLTFVRVGGVLLDLKDDAVLGPSFAEFPGKVADEVLEPLAIRQRGRGDVHGEHQARIEGEELLQHRFSQAEQSDLVQGTGESGFIPDTVEELSAAFAIGAFEEEFERPCLFPPRALGRAVGIQPVDGLKVVTVGEVINGAGIPSGRILLHDGLCNGLQRVFGLWGFGFCANGRFP